MKTIWEQRRQIAAFVLAGAMLGLAARVVAVMAKAAAASWWPALGIGAVAGAVAGLGWLFARPQLSRAHIAKVTLSIGGAGAEVAFDPGSREQLWRFFIEMTSRIATRALPHGDAVLEEALTSLYSLFERARTDLSAHPPRGPVLTGTVPPHVYVLDILNEDLRPCTARWHGRLEAWKRTGRPEVEWPLADACREDIERTRQRIVERAWQLGETLGIPELGRLLPARPAAVPALQTVAELQQKEAAAGAPESSEALKAGWHIYVAAITRIATQELPPGAGVLGEALASLYTLTGKIRDELAAIPPSPSLAAADGIAALGIRLLNDGLRPFLAEWHPRYEAFKISGLPEARWEEADACRAALAQTRQRCLAIVGALGQKIGAPP